MPESATDPTPTKKRRRWWRWSLRILLVLMLAFCIFRFVVHQRVVNRINAIRDAGYPVTLEELDAWYTYPDGPNAADVYQRAFEAYVKDDYAERNLPIVGTSTPLSPGQKLDPALAMRIASYLKRNAGAIVLLEEATETSGCKYPVEWGDGLGAMLPHLGKLRQGARLLKLQSILAADEGDYDRAIDRCIKIILLARSLDQEPLLICSVTSVSISRIAGDQIEHLIQTEVVNDTQLHMIAAAAFTPEEVRAMIHRALVGERAIGNLRFQGNGVPQDLWDKMSVYMKARTYLRRFAGIEDLDQAYWLDYWAIMIEEAAEPAWPPHDESWYPDLPPSIYTESYWYCNLFNAGFKNMWRVKAESQVFAVGIAAERYRLQHGALPGQLKDLVPEFLDAVPTDLFDGQPLRYRVEDGGAIIYSIGPDETDHGGRKYDNGGGLPNEGVDITFTFGGLQEKIWPSGEDEDEQRE